MMSPTDSNNPFSRDIKSHRKSHTSRTVEEIKIEKFLKLIEQEIKKHNFNIDQRCFIENIIKLLDNLSQVNINKINKI